MFFTAWISIAVCIAAMMLTLLIQQNTRTTLGLPLAYMISLLLIHVPGAFAFATSGGAYAGLQGYGSAIERGMMLTAVASVCFVIGVILATTGRTRSNGAVALTDTDIATGAVSIDPKFSIFCLIAGWILAFGVGPLRAIPTLGAAIFFGSAIWMLSALVGLAKAVQVRNGLGLLFWLAILMVFPVTVLVSSGFLSYGSAAVIVVGSLAVIRMNRPLRSLLVIVALGYLGLSIFVNYFGSRNALRKTIWGGAVLEQRIDAVAYAFRDFKLLSFENAEHMRALSLRLNQNEFVGISAERLDNGQAEYLLGSSFGDALLSPIPRAIWTDKPLGGGSGDIVRDMTGMHLRKDTSWGVGNVMEFYINFGWWSLIPGFVLLGWLIGWTDRRAAAALRTADYSRTLFYFLPGIALIQPNGSLVEVIGGAFAALLAAIALRLGWTMIRQSWLMEAGQAASPVQRVLR